MYYFDEESLSDDISGDKGDLLRVDISFCHFLFQCAVL